MAVESIVSGVLLIGGVALALGALVMVWRGRQGGGALPLNGDGIDVLRRLAQSQMELTGRLSQMAESQSLAQAQLAERLQAQERHVSRVLEQRLEDLGRQVGERLQASGQQTVAQMHEVRERLAVIDQAQKTMTDLSSQIISLQDILGNKQSRGAFGEIQLHDLITTILPPSVCRFQAVLSNGRRADCLLALPNPPGSIVVDAKFPLESYYALRAACDEAASTQASRSFASDVLKHVKDISERYIIPGETAESALMFLPSEAVYAELYARFPEVVEKSYRARVWIVSPTTLMATLTTVRAVLKDATMREQSGIIQAEVVRLLDDLKRLDGRVGKLATHFSQTQEDVRQVQISTDKLLRRGEAIESLHVDGGVSDQESGGLVPPPLP
jgi:DNA recombination protein RmuC